MQVREAMSPVAAAYQSKITGVAGDMSYVVNGVRFDGYKAGRLLEAKGPGYAKFIKNGEYAGWFRGKNALLNQANRQTKAAGKTPIEWHFAEEAAANATRNLFVTQKIKGIKVIYNP